MTYANGLNLNLIEGTFGGASGFLFDGKASTVIQAQNMGASGCFPAAKIGSGNYIYAYTNGGINYYGLSGIGVISAAPIDASEVSPALTVIQAYTIDTKIDDGMAASGRVQTNYEASLAIVASPSAPAGSYTNTTCSDSGTGAYATTSSYGGTVCNLSFQMQGGD